MINARFKGVALGFLGLVVLVMVFTAGAYLSGSNGSVNPEPEAQKVVDIYYLKADGIYRVSSNSEGEEKVVDSQPSYSQYANHGHLSLAGSANDWLVYSDSVGLQAIHIPDGEITPIETTSDTAEINYFSVSPNGEKVAFIKNITTEEGFGFKNELWLLEIESGNKQKLLSEPELGSDPEGVYYALALNGWLDDNRLLVGRAYEGVSYCVFTIGTDHVLPQDCSGYGSEGIGLFDRVLATKEGMAFGSRHVYAEFGDQRSETGIFRQMGEDKTFLSDDVAISMVADKDQLFFIKSFNPNRSLYQESDIYQMDVSGDLVKRLTHDSTSVASKNQLRLSSGGRFLSWYNLDHSRLVEYSTAELIAAGSAWVYDLKLNQYYRVSDQAIFPVVIER